MCGNFPCSALLNGVAVIEGAQTSGNSNSLPNGGDFSIIAGNSYYDNFETHTGDTISKCSYKQKWDAFSCTDTNAGQLLFESLDEDSEDRAVHPIFVYNTDIEDGGIYFNNTVNAFMDDCMDGFYTCLKRKAKFPSVVYLDNNNNEYNIKFTGTPPASMRFRLRGDRSAPGMIVNIKFPISDSYSVHNWNAG